MKTGSPPAVPTIAASAARKLVELGSARGLDRAELSRVAALDGDVADPEARVAAERVYDLWAHLARSLDDPGLPIRYAEHSRMEDFSVMGFAVMTSRTRREAIERVVRYGRLYGDSGGFDYEVRGDRAEIRWHRSAPLSLGVRLSNEAAVAQFAQGVRGISRSEGSVLAVGFRHAAPRDVEAHRRFFACRVEFGASYDGLSIPAGDLDRPTGHSPALGAFVARQADALLAEAPIATIAERVRQAVSRSLASGEPAATATAQHLGMSERTLRRRLDEEGASFRDLVDGVRRQRAEELLRMGRAAITEVAFLLGFSDVSAFSRAFRRWHGMSPRRFRALQLEGAASKG